MKIIHVAPINNKVSGISNSVKNLAESQSTYVKSIGVISSQSDNLIFSNKVSVYSISKDTLLEILFRKSFNRIIKVFGEPNIIVFHDVYNLKQSLFLISILGKNIKIYITPRGAFSPVALNRSFIKKKLYYLIFIKPFINYIDAFIALNENESNYIYNFTSKKTIIMPNGVQDNYTNYIKNIGNYNLKEKSTDINVGFLGRFDIFIKGLDDLLEAYVDFQRLNEKIKINLIFIGSHSKNNEFNSKKYFDKIKNNLINPESFIIKGPFYGEKKWLELSKLDILIQPSRTEGMPNTVLEAMSMGIPCCVTKDTNMGDIILKSNSGWVIDRDKKSLLKFFSEIISLSKSNFIKKGMNGMIFSKKNLSWDEASKPNYF